MDATTPTYWDALDGRFAKRTVASPIPASAPAIEPGTPQERIERMRANLAARKSRQGSTPAPTDPEVLRLLGINPETGRLFCFDNFPGNKSGTASPVGFECAAGFTSLNENRKEEVEELLARCAGYGARRRKRIKRERIERLHDPRNRAKASATKKRKNALKNADPKVREDRAWRRYRRIVEEDGPLDRRMRKVSSTVNAGGSYNRGVERLQVSIAEFRKPNFKTDKRAYLLNADSRQVRGWAMRDYNELRLLFLAGIGKPATYGLPAPSPVRSKVESQFETFVNSQLLPSVALEYPELSDPAGSNELFVGSDGYFYAGVRDYDIDLGDTKIQVQVKGIAHLYYRAKEIFSSDNDRLYRSLRSDLFNLLLRYHQNSIFSRFADTELRPMYLVSATSIRAWSKEGKPLKDDKALLDLLARESERTLDYLLQFARAVFPKEYEVFERLVGVWNIAVSALPHDSVIDLLDLLENYRDELAAARDAVRFWPTFRGDNLRAHNTCWSDVKKKLPRRFTPTKL